MFYVIYGEVISKKTKPHTSKSTAYTVKNKVKNYFDYEFDSVLTIFELRIIEVLKGRTEQNIIEVVVAGGCFDGRCVEYSHSYDYEIKDNVLLFLIKNEDGYYITSNGSYDAFIVKENNEISRKTESVIYPSEQSMLENIHLESEMSLEKLKRIIDG